MFNVKQKETLTAEELKQNGLTVEEIKQITDRDIKELSEKVQGIEAILKPIHKAWFSSNRNSKSFEYLDSIMQDISLCKTILSVYTDTIDIFTNYLACFFKLIALFFGVNQKKKNLLKTDFSFIVWVGYQ